MRIIFFALVVLASGIARGEGCDPSIVASIGAHQAACKQTGATDCDDKAQTMMQDCSSENSSTAQQQANSAVATEDAAAAADPSGAIAAWEQKKKASCGTSCYGNIEGAAGKWNAANPTDDSSGNSPSDGEIYQ